MKYQGEELVRVQSESELRAGMTVWTRQAMCCGATHARVLLRKLPPTACEAVPETIHSNTWLADGTHADEDGICYCVAIAEGRLYRLRDEAPPQETETTTPSTRERQREDAR